MYADKYLLADHDLMANAKVVVHLESTVEVNICPRLRDGAAIATSLADERPAFGSKR